MKAIQLMSAMALAMAVLPCTAEVPWFDAGVADYVTWPADKADYEVVGSGFWRNTCGATLLAQQPSALKIDAAGGQDALTFDLSDPRTADGDPLTIDVAVAAVEVSELEPMPADARLAYAKKSGVWYRWSDGQWSEVADGSVREANGRATLHLTVAAARSVAFAGEGTLSALSGSIDKDAQSFVLTLPPLDNLTAREVRAGGAVVLPDEDGSYSVPEGALVTVSFAAADGYFVNVPYMTFRMGSADTELPVAGRPEAVAAKGLVRINEIMASNGSTVRTANGKKGLDWVELYNDADFEVDLTGWYLFDDPTKKQSKWKTLEGKAVIPAKGYLIVWADKDYEGFTADECVSRIGLSASGEPLFLATPGGKKIDVIDDFGKSVKDISQGVNPAHAGLVYFRTPTPGAVNADEAYSAPTDEVAFSVAHGWLTEPVEVALSCATDPTAVIRYTLDGTSPTAESPVYEQPIRVASTTVIRAAVANENSVLQYDSSATYLFVEDVLRQGPDAPAGFPANRGVNNQAMRYGLDSEVVAAYRERILNGFTNSVSTVSLVIDPACLFDRRSGIYVNAERDGSDWERPVSVELFSPTGAEAGFAVPAGLRIRGAGSRGSGYPKHAFRLFFKSLYGLSKLSYPLFGSEGAKEYQKIDFRCSQNFAWCNNDDRETFVHEVFSRDSQRDLGQPYNRSRYYNLFINGQYWGLYQSEERCDEDYAESYLGGDAGDYDVVRTSQPGYVTGVVEGSEDAWQALCERGEGANWKSLMTYMLIAHYTGDTDCPWCWQEGGKANNINALYNRKGSGKVAGWFFNRHDAEWSLGMGAENTVLFGTGMDQLTKSPAGFHYRLWKNDDAYRRQFADFLYRQCLYDGGQMTDAKAIARFRARMAEIDSAIACESARWGSETRTYDQWLENCAACIRFMTGRGAKVIKQYRDAGLFPADYIPPPKPFSVRLR